MSETAAISETTHLTALRSRIGWICQTIRALIVGFAIADFFTILNFWADHDQVERHFGAVMKIDVSGASAAQYAIAVTLSLIVWVFVAVACFCLWRVFSLYLRGSIFTAESALWLRRAGVLGFVTVLLDVATRSAVICALAAHLSPQQSHHVLLRLDDLLYVIFTLVVIALAQIFKTAAEIAGEHAQFV